MSVSYFHELILSPLTVSITHVQFCTMISSFFACVIDVNRAVTLCPDCCNDDYLKVVNLFSFM